MYKKLYFAIFIISFALYLISTTNGKLVKCNVSVESKVCFLVDDYVTTGIEKYLDFLFLYEVVIYVLNSNNLRQKYPMLFLQQ